MNKEAIIKAGEIAKKIKLEFKDKIKKGDKLLDIANKIENRIIELGGFPAFPVNLSINEIAAHYTPTYNDESTAYGLMKVDFGVHIDGWVADTAFTLDLEDTKENKKLIEASKSALENVEKEISSEKTLGEVGKIVESTIKSYGFNPIANLSGHSMEQYDLHAGMSIPNVNTNSNIEFNEGLYAVEPFATNGKGRVHDGPKGNIMMLVSEKNIRSPGARQVLEYIKDNYGTLPFASRWVIKEFQTRGIIALRQLENEGILHHFTTLVEEKGKLVSQKENTFLIEKNKVIITSKED